jgi:hypothetical protein
MTKKSSVNRGTDETFYQLMQVSGGGILKLIGIDANQAESYHFQAVVLKDKRLLPDLEGIPLWDTKQGRVLIEFQGYADPYIRYRLATAVLWSSLQGHYESPVTAAIIYTEAAYREVALPLRAFANRPQCQLHGCLQELVLTDYSETQLTAIDPRLIVLAPFTVPAQLPAKQLQLHAEHWQTQLQQAFSLPAQQQEALNVLSLFVFSRFQHLSREEVIHMFHLDLMTTVAGRQVHELGLQQGIQQGLQQGRVQQAQDYVLETLQEKFGKVPTKLVNQIRAITSPEQLQTLFHQALRCQNLTEFKATLRQLN